MEEWKPNFADPEEIKKRKEQNFEQALDATDKNNETLLKAKYMLESLLGIKLSNIELSALSKITREVIKDSIENNSQVISEKSKFAPNLEIPARFLHSMYGITSMEELKKIFPPEKDEKGDDVWPTPMMHEFFQREQAKLHHEL